jgi:hypothetical protein
LFYVPVPETDNGLVTFRSDNPFQQQHAAFSVLSNSEAESIIAELAFVLFAKNGHESCPLFGGLPTSIAHEDNWQESAMAPTFNRTVARLLFKGAAHAVWPLNMKSVCEYLKRYPDPWERSAAELDEGLLSVLVRAEDEPTTFDEVLFDEWFELVSDPKHLAVERANFAAAWQGAIEFRNRK